MLIILSGCGGRVSSVKKRERKKKALNNLKQGSEVEIRQERLVDGGLSVPLALWMEVCTHVRVGDLLS